MRYHDDTDALIRSDIEELRGDPEPISASEGQLKAIVLEFSLPSSSYATMALREVLKADTSAASQYQLQQNVVAKRALEANELNSMDDNEAKKSKVDHDEILLAAEVTE